MGIEVIDGTIEEVSLRGGNAKVALYDRIVIRTADGSERRLEKLAVSPNVSSMLERGTLGRFYGYKAIDHCGLLAARTQDGRAAFAIPSGNEQIMLMMTFAGIGAAIVLLLLGKAIGILALILAGVGAALYVSYRRTRIEARARYDADAGYSASSSSSK